MSSSDPVSGQDFCTRDGRQWPGRSGSEQAAGSARSIPWNILFAGLVVIGFLNGMSHRVMGAIREDAGGALLHTFNVSAIVWLALVACVVLLLSPPERSDSRRDLLAAGLAFFAFLVPVSPLSWVALSALGFYLAMTSPAGSPPRRGAWILLALTVPMFWSRLGFMLMSDVILRIDAVLVSLLLGTARAGNTIAFADGWGYFWIAPPCSSLANVSLAFLCWVLVTQFLDRAREASLRYCFMAVAAVMAINVTRLALTGISRASYDIVHGATGSAVTGALTMAATLAICLYGATYGARHADPIHR